MDDLGVPLFQETSTYVYIYTYIYTHSLNNLFNNKCNQPYMWLNRTYIIFSTPTVKVDGIQSQPWWDIEPIHMGLKGGVKEWMFFSMKLSNKVMRIYKIYNQPYWIWWDRLTTMYDFGCVWKLCLTCLIRMMMMMMMMMMLIVINHESWTLWVPQCQTNTNIGHSISTVSNSYIYNMLYPIHFLDDKPQCYNAFIVVFWWFWWRIHLLIQAFRTHRLSLAASNSLAFLVRALFLSKA